MIRGFLSLTFILALTQLVSCKLGSQGGGEAGSSSSSIGFAMPIPDNVASKMGSMQAKLTANVVGSGTFINTTLVFSEPVQKGTGGGSSSVEFAKDTQGLEPLKKGMVLENIKLVILGNNKPVYEGSNPNRVTLSGTITEVNFNLKCTDASICNTYEQLTINGLAGDKDKVAESVKLKVNVKIEQQGQTEAERRSILKQCVAEVKKYPSCDADYFTKIQEGTKKCSDLYKLTDAAIDALEPGAGTVRWLVDDYVKLCKDLSIVVAK